MTKKRLMQLLQLNAEKQKQEAKKYHKPPSGPDGYSFCMGQAIAFETLLDVLKNEEEMGNA